MDELTLKHPHHRLSGKALSLAYLFFLDGEATVTIHALIIAAYEILGRV
jgi:hypothetical protein